MIELNKIAAAQSFTTSEPQAPSPAASAPAVTPPRIINAALTQGEPNAGPSLPPPVRRPSKTPAPTTPAPEAASPLPKNPFDIESHLVVSPASIADFLRFYPEKDAFTDPDTPSGAWADIMTKLYEIQLGVPPSASTPQKFNEALANFRKHFCNDSVKAGCAMPTTTGEDAQKIIDTIKDPAVLAQLEKLGYHVHPVVYVNSPRAFDYIAAKTEMQRSSTESFWEMPARPLQWTYTRPLLRDVDSYAAGTQVDGVFHGEVGFEGDKLLINDWRVRRASIDFAKMWKFAIDGRGGATTNDIARLYAKMYDECAGEFAATYNELLPKVASSPEASKRFAEARQAGGYPDEVFQHVAYHHLIDLVNVEAAYLKLASEHRKDVSADQVKLEAFLTLQRYAPKSARFLQMELLTLAQPFTSRVSVLGQIGDFDRAMHFSVEQLYVILGMDGYDTSNFERLRYSILDDAMFEPKYLQRVHPDIYKELLQDDGTLKRVADLPREDQIRILKSYLTQKSPSAFLNMQAAFGRNIKPEDAQYLADVIHARRYKDGKPVDPPKQPQQIVPPGRRYAI